MKRGQPNSEKVKRQRGDFARDLHYANVVAVGLTKAELEKRRKRLDAIVEKGLKKGKIVLTRGRKREIMSIDTSGMLTLENWETIDPLSL